MAVDISRRKKNRSNEKVVSIRLSKTFLSKYNELNQEYNVTPKQIFIEGLLTTIEKKKNSKEVELMAALRFLNEENFEYYLKIQANDLLIEKINEKWDMSKEKNSENKKSSMIRLIEDEHNQFMKNNAFEENVRYDLDEFFIYCRNPINTIAMRHGTGYDVAIKIYEEYYERKVEFDLMGDENIVVSN